VEKERKTPAVEQGDLVVDGSRDIDVRVSHGGYKRPVRSKLWMHRKLHIEDAGLPAPIYKVQKQVESPPPQQKDNQKQRDTGPVANCNAPQKSDGVGENSKPPLTTIEEETENECARQRTLADCCAVGEISIGQVYAATNPLQISFQLIHPAAVNTIPSVLDNTRSLTTTSGADTCTRSPPRAQNNTKARSIRPRYSRSQKVELRQVLSAALHLVHSAYTPLLDSRTGFDVLPWLFRGKSFQKSVYTDYSTMHVAVLFAGSTIAGVACVRSLGNGIAEIPIFTIRQELRRNRLGEHFLSQIEKVLHQAGITLIITPAMILPGWPFTPSSFPRDPEAEKNQNVPYQPMQSKWRYTLATKEEMQKIAKLRPLAFPGVYTCVKRLWCTRKKETEVKGTISLNVEPTNHIENDASINQKPLVPRPLSHSLAIAPEINVDVLRENGFIEFRCDQGTSKVIPMNAAPGFELIIKTATAAVVTNGGSNVLGVGKNQGSIERAGSRGPRGVWERSSGCDFTVGINEGEKQHKQELTLSPGSELKPAKRKYTKRKQRGTDLGNGSDDGIGNERRNQTKNLGVGKSVVAVGMERPLAPSVFLVQHGQQYGQEQQQLDRVPRTREDLGPPSRGAAPLLQYDYPTQPQFPPGVPVLRSLVHPNHPLPLHNQHHNHVPHDLTTLEQIQVLQAQQLAQMEDAIRQKQASLLQGMNGLREQQQQLQQQQKDVGTFGYVVSQQIGGGNYYPAGQGQHSFYNGTASSTAGLVSGVGGTGYDHHPHQQQYFQQQFDELAPLQNIYENHQRLQHHHQQMQNSVMAPHGFDPGQLYNPSSQAQQAQQQQQQEFNPLFMPPAATVAAPPSSYYYGDGNADGM